MYITRGVEIRGSLSLGHHRESLVCPTFLWLQFFINLFCTRGQSTIRTKNSLGKSFSSTVLWLMVIVPRTFLCHDALPLAMVYLRRRMGLAIIDRYLISWVSYTKFFLLTKIITSLHCNDIQIEWYFSIHWVPWNKENCYYTKYNVDFIFQYNF